MTSVVFISIAIVLSVIPLFLEKLIVLKNNFHVAAIVFTPFLSYALLSEYASSYFSECKTSILFFLIYAAVLAMILIPIRFLTNIPSFIFRKLLHFSCFAIVIPVSLICNNGVLTAIIVGSFMFLIINTLGLFDSCSWYGKLFVEKKHNEVKASFAIFFILYSVLSILGYFLHTEYLPIVSVLAWGPGDAGAALVGIPFGKHKWNLKFVDPNKSIEGTLANAAVTFVSVLVSLLILCPVSWYWSVLLSLVIALACPFMELISKRGIDTLSVPLTGFILLLVTIIL